VYGTGRDAECYYPVFVYWEGLSERGFPCFFPFRYSSSEGERDSKTGLKKHRHRPERERERERDRTRGREKKRERERYGKRGASSALVTHQRMHRNLQREGEEEGRMKWENQRETRSRR
jgi:hypothetical protein